MYVEYRDKEVGNLVALQRYRTLLGQLLVAMLCYIIE